MSQQDMEKKLVGEAAASYVEDGMTVGLGSGSTATEFVKALAKRVTSESLKIKTVSTSGRTTKLATSLGIDVSDLNDVSSIDLTVDGCDEFDPTFNGIKGGGGALLFEKIVAAQSTKNIWVADASKRKQQLGAFPLPVEVSPFGFVHVQERLKHQGLKPQLRCLDNGEWFETDSHNYILDCHVGTTQEPERLSVWLNNLAGVVENGLFINMVDEVIIPDNGEVTVLKKAVI
ncbi:ribose-5-phosphate isomerase RpiA [Tuberibacillus sp. Marseille-P3662]|uniref:ribose-5-phosphate isomerase RpiA n=1 Tax=Tuberibacillus sp. Marseille-P3662 TaxID=1965358 RepID=UPI000A1CDBAE|nr:ribose-5-phosphate isomerase RpiA [Tuberibacillus sp. Marseille-P3662]